MSSHGEIFNVFLNMYVVCSALKHAHTHSFISIYEVSKLI